MTGLKDARFRLELAAGFLAEARQDVDLQRWRSAVDNSQLAVENAAKAVLALVGAVGRTHNPAAQLRQRLSDGVLPQDVAARVERLAAAAETLGPDVHAETDYGDEEDGLTPWQLFDQSDGLEALGHAEEAYGLSSTIIGIISSQ